MSEPTIDPMIEAINSKIMRNIKRRATEPSDISTASHFEFLRVYELLGDLASVLSQHELRIRRKKDKGDE